MPKKNLTVYIIEDDQFIRMFLHDMFLIFGHEIQTKLHLVGDSTKATELLKSTEQTPHMIFLDLGLPASEHGIVDANAGFKLMELIKADNRLKDIPVIMFSGYSDPEIMQKALAMGAKEFLVKGEYMPRDIMDIVKKYNT